MTVETVADLIVAAALILAAAALWGGDPGQGGGGGDAATSGAPRDGSAPEAGSDTHPCVAASGAGSSRSGHPAEGLWGGADDPGAVPGHSADDPPGGGAVDRAGTLDRAVVLDLASAALAGGASVPATLQALGACGAGPELAFAGRSLLLGATWDEACADVPPRHRALLDALAPAWTAGADPAPLLRHAADVVRAGRRREAELAAARLGVRLVVPVGLCHLPAFVALGLVPIVLSFVGDLAAW